MLDLLVALAGEPSAVQTAPASPLKVINTAFIVENLSPPFTGDIRVVIQNTGATPDELVSVTTPLGETLELRTDGDLFSDQDPVSLPIALPPPADRPSYLPLVVRVPGLSTSDYWSTGTTVTLRFAHAGEMTVAVSQASPAPPPARR